MEAINKLYSYMLMYLSFLIYSLSTIFSKLASMQVFMSLKYVCCFGVIIFILGIYAVLWQQVLKKIELSIAMSNKPIVLVFSTLWALFLFDEQISTKYLFGMLLIFSGIFIVGVKNE